MTEKVIVAGFGGQGVILAGKLIANAGMIEGKSVSHIPSYGAEMRGGTANCSVMVSDREIASPFIFHPTSILVMNKPSLDKFEPAVMEDGVVLINESLIERKAERDDVRAFYVPANKLAEEAGSGRASNMIMLGAFCAVVGVVDLDSIKRSLPALVSARNIKYNEINVRALDMGFSYARDRM